MNVLDVVSVVNSILDLYEPNSTEFLAGDVNSDGTLNILDAVIIVNWILGAG